MERRKKKLLALNVEDTLVSEKTWESIAYYTSVSPLSHWTNQYYFEDTNSLPRVEFYGQLEFQPVNAAQYAIAHFDYNKTNLTEELKELYQSWFLEFKEHHPKYYYRFDLKKYNMKAPWVSALAFANMIGLYLRYYKAFGTGEKEIFELFDELEKEPVRTVFQEKLWFEEYPSTPPSYVYNGFITVVIAYIEAAIVFPENKLFRNRAMELQNVALEVLPLYDNGLFLKYDYLTKHPIQTKYYFFQKNQFIQLYELTKNEAYRQLADDFENYQKKPDSYFDLLDTLFYTRRNDFPEIFN